MAAPEGHIDAFAGEVHRDAGVDEVGWMIGCWSCLNCAKPDIVDIGGSKPRKTALRRSFASASQTVALLSSTPIRQNESSRDAGKSRESSMNSTGEIVDLLAKVRSV